MRPFDGSTDDIDGRATAPRAGKDVGLAFLPGPVDRVGRGKVVKDPVAGAVSFGDPDGHQAALLREPRISRVAAGDDARAGGPMRVVAVRPGMAVAVHKVFLVDDGGFQGRVLGVDALVEHGHPHVCAASGYRPCGTGGHVRAGDPRVTQVVVVPQRLVGRCRRLDLGQQTHEVRVCRGDHARARRPPWRRRRPGRLPSRPRRVL